MEKKVGAGSDQTPNPEQLLAYYETLDNQVRDIKQQMKRGVLTPEDVQSLIEHRTASLVPEACTEIEELLNISHPPEALPPATTRLTTIANVLDVATDTIDDIEGMLGIDFGKKRLDERLTALRAACNPTVLLEDIDELIVVSILTASDDITLRNRIEALSDSLRARVRACREERPVELLDIARTKILCA